MKLCVSPVTSSFKVAITSNGKVEPFVEKGSNKYFLNENNGFDITVSTEDNMTSDDMRNLCLWSNMDGDEVTYKKIKQHIDNVRDACWTTDDGKKSGVRLGNQTGLYTETYINKSNSWFDSVDAAEKDIVTSMIVYREHFNLPADEYTIYWNGNTPYFEIVGADKHVAKPHNRCVTVFVWDSTGTYRLAILYTVPDSKVHSAIEQFAVAHYHNKYPAECECWHWDKTELRYIPQAQIN